MPFLIVSFAELRPGLNVETLEYIRRSRAVLQGVEGFVSSSLWQSTHNINQYLVLGHYRDEEAAKSGMEALERGGLILQTMEMLSQPPEVYGFNFDYATGVLPGDTWVGEILSMSRQNADVGFGQELIAELTTIFQSLEVIEGFRGWLVATNRALPDQVMGLAFWHDAMAYNASLPAHPTYEVLSFTRTH